MNDTGQQEPGHFEKAADMTSNVFTWAQPARPRRATFVASPGHARSRRLPARAAVIAAAITVSAATVGVLVPLAF